ncbi:MAG: class I SAM-dependent methyltransferase [Patescibacteria group bacterium]|nr:class I SAM-dependent methyltransferase [Patescibacteria group bacterium]
MQNLPPPEIYALEHRYLPWGSVIADVADLVCQWAPHYGRVLDMMCGPGVLLERLAKKRVDLRLHGVDQEPACADYAKKTFGFEIDCADARQWEPKVPDPFDVVVCTAGLHHLPYADQKPFIGKLKSLLKSGTGTLIIADPCILPFRTEKERRTSSAVLGHATLLATIESEPPREILDAVIGILRNDVLGVEYKMSAVIEERMLKKHFRHVISQRIWPNDDPRFHGDYIFLAHD